MMTARAAKYICELRIQRVPEPARSESCTEQELPNDEFFTCCGDGDLARLFAALIFASFRLDFAFIIFSAFFRFFSFRRALFPSPKMPVR